MRAFLLHEGHTGLVTLRADLAERFKSLGGLVSEFELPPTLQPTIEACDAIAGPKGVADWVERWPTITP